MRRGPRPVDRWEGGRSGVWAAAMGAILFVTAGAAPPPATSPERGPEDDSRRAAEERIEPVASHAPVPHGGVATIGREVAVPAPLRDGDEHRLPMARLLDHGRLLFEAAWTTQEGGGRPLVKGTGAPLSDPSRLLEGVRSFNRVSGPDATACSDCHSVPFGAPGGSGGFAGSVFVLGQRFDFIDLAADDPLPTVGSHDELGRPVTLDRAANLRASVGMYGAGYIEMLAREMTAELVAIRDSLAPGEGAPLVAKGISFGHLRRIEDGRWDVTRVEGLPADSLANWGSDGPPSLVVSPFHQSGSAVSLRDFTVNALNHHHGIQAAERFGDGVDHDGDGHVDELSRAGVTALVLFQAALPVPGRVIPRIPAVEAAILDGEQVFQAIGCARCHVPSLPLSRRGQRFVEPGPYNEPLTLQDDEAEPVVLDLSDPALPPPRLARDEEGAVWVPAFTDLKLHDLTDGPDDPAREPLDMNQRFGSPGFFAGNASFLTRALWGAANQPPFFHHGRFTTLRESILAHGGEARPEADAFRALPPFQQDCLVEFLKSLQVLPPGSRHRIVDEAGKPRSWPPAGAAPGR